MTMEYESITIETMEKKQNFPSHAGLSGKALIASLFIISASNGADASYMNVGKDKVDTAGKNSRANAFSVRCVKVD